MIRRLSFLRFSLRPRLKPGKPRIAALLFAACLTVTATLPALAQEGTAPVPPDLTDENVVGVMTKAVDEVIRPGYRAFHTSAGALARATDAFCAAPSAEARQAVDTAFRQAVADWGRIEIVRIGPVLDDNRFERILFYPDRKSTGLKQVQALLQKQDPADADAATMGARSVAIQGFGALEFALYGTGADALMAGPDGFRCRYAAAVASHIEKTAGQLVAAWDAPDGVQRDWKHPGPQNPVFRTGREAMTALLGILVHGAEAVRDQRIETFYRHGGIARPKSALFWRSGNTWVSIGANIEGLRALFDTSGMAGLIDPGFVSIGGNIDFVLKALARVTPTIDPDIEKAVSTPGEQQKIAFLLVNSRDLIERLNGEYGTAMGLGAGFSFADGD
ncbi:imelysin family protein [Shinella sumterensis]|uniref:Imelysin family protein n=1 Tax=Shinella sumterensis TaxID=1967501 RepID=A0AA50CLT9_9HYPH|nr:imelysin family protein [Shinella sumterensis]WLR96819.1 imelysin family protein [Shinella sumterensis]